MEIQILMELVIMGELQLLIRIVLLAVVAAVLGYQMIMLTMGLLVEVVAVQVLLSGLWDLVELAYRVRDLMGGVLLRLVTPLPAVAVQETKALGITELTAAPEEMAQVRIPVYFH
jgi:hypothetical protein